jgi:hypothetical protein
MKGFGVIIPSLRFQYSKHKNCCIVKDAFRDQGVELPVVSTEMCVFLYNAGDQDLKSVLSSLLDIFMLKLYREHDCWINLAYYSGS